MADAAIRKVIYTTVPRQAARGQRLPIDRGRARRKAGGGTPRKLPSEAIVTAARRIIPLPEDHGITCQHGCPRITTPEEPRRHAATAGTTPGTA